MNDLRIKETTISSREIAELTEKGHRHVRRDVENLNETYEKMALPKVGHSMYRNENNGQFYKEFLLTFMQTMDLMTGYRTDLRIKVNRRWEELEKASTPKVPQSFADALRLAADQAEQIALMTPKAELADKALRDESKHYSITDAGKHIGLSQSKMFALMREKKLITRKNLPTQKAIELNILQLRTNVDCNGKNRPQSIMTMEQMDNFRRRYVDD
jgi:phage antirepressor YoqD-like protein